MPGSRGAGTLAAPRALALLLLVLAASSQLAAAGDIISSSKLESCIADGSQVWFPGVLVLGGQQQHTHNNAVVNNAQQMKLLKECSAMPQRHKQPHGAP